MDRSGPAYVSVQLPLKSIYSVSFDLLSTTFIVDCVSQHSYIFENLYSGVIGTTPVSSEVVFGCDLYSLVER